MSYPVTTEEHKGCTIEIWAEEGPGDPYKEFDQVTTILGREDRNYTFGQEQVRIGDAYDERAWREVLREYDADRRIAFVVPMTHSDYDSSWTHGDLMRVSEVPADDVETDAYCIAYRDTVLEEAPGKGKIITPKVRAWLARIAHAEIEAYSHWTSGSVYGWTALDEDGEVIDSCGGYYCDWDEKDGPFDEAEATIDRHVKDRKDAQSMQTLLNR